MVGPSFLTLTMFKIVTKVVVCLEVLEFMLSIFLKNSLIIHEENTKKKHKRVVSVYVIQRIHVDLHKL